MKSSGDLLKSSVSPLKKSGEIMKSSSSGDLTKIGSGELAKSSSGEIEDVISFKLARVNSLLQSLCAAHMDSDFLRSFLLVVWRN